ncbi:hypothetical protein DERP_011024, partial [Dermatophagoides pteronyssinus]
MPMPFARVMSEELLRAPQINVSANRRRLAIIETPTSVNRSRNNGRLVYPRLNRIRRNLFDNKNKRPPTPTPMIVSVIKGSSRHECDTTTNQT